MNAHPDRPLEKTPPTRGGELTLFSCRAFSTRPPSPFWAQYEDINSSVVTVGRGVMQ